MGEFVSLYTTAVFAKVEGGGRRQENQQGCKTNMACALGDGATGLSGEGGS